MARRVSWLSSRAGTEARPWRSQAGSRAGTMQASSTLAWLAGRKRRPVARVACLEAKPRAGASKAPWRRVSRVLAWLTG